MANPRVDKVLFSAAAIQQRVADLAAAVAADYGPGELAAVAVLKGSYAFVTDLARELVRHRVRLVVDYLRLSSYGAGTESRGAVQVHQDLARPLRDRRVLLVDDILDTGLTLLTARDLLLRHGARDVRTCVLLDKPSRRQFAVRPDYVGFTVDDVFVVGYGLDFDGQYRNLPHIAALAFAGATEPAAPGP
jgi:hypoxanthine phosphoribosyltransferase